MGIWELVSSLFGGGLVGLLGSVISNIMSYKTEKLKAESKRQDQAHEVAMKRADAEIMQQEFAARTKIAVVEAEGREAEADAKAFEASLGSEPMRYSEAVKPTTSQGWLLILMDAFRAIVRPGLTVYLCVLTTLLYRDAHKLLSSQAFTQAMAEKLTADIVQMILFLTSTCVLWWFGTRNKNASPRV